MGWKQKTNEEDIKIEYKAKRYSFDGKYISFAGKKYAIDLIKLEEACLISDNQKNNEKEITEAYERDSDGNITMSSRIIREVKTAGNSQNDMIIYDLIKLFVIRLMENTLLEHEFEPDFSTSLAFNTLINWGILKEIND